MNFLNKVEGIFRKENKKSISDSKEYIDGMINNFNENLLLVEDKIKNWPSDPNQDFLSNAENDLKKMQNILQEIEEVFKGTKEGEEYSAMERQNAKKPDSHMAFEMFELIRGTPVEDLPSMKKKFFDLEREFKYKPISLPGTGVIEEGVDF